MWRVLALGERRNQLSGAGESWLAPQEVGQVLWDRQVEPHGPMEREDNMSITVVVVCQSQMHGTMPTEPGVAIVFVVGGSV